MSYLLVFLPECEKSCENCDMIHLFIHYSEDVYSVAVVELLKQ